MIRLPKTAKVLVQPVHFNFFFLFILVRKKVAVNNKKNTVDFSVFKDNKEKECFLKQLIEEQLSLAKLFTNLIGNIKNLLNDLEILMDAVSQSNIPKKISDKLNDKIKIPEFMIIFEPVMDENFDLLF